MESRPSPPQKNMKENALLSTQCAVKYVLENYPQTKNNFIQFLNNPFWVASLYGARRFGVRDDEIDQILRKTNLSRFLPPAASHNFSYLHTEKERPATAARHAIKANCDETFTLVQNFDPSVLERLPQERAKEIILAWISYQRGSIDKIETRFNQTMYEARKLAMEPVD